MPDFNVRRIHLNSRPVPNTDALIERFGEFFNRLYVASNADGRVIAHFTLFNAVGWQIVLAENGGSPNLQMDIINDPLNPENWSTIIDEELLIPFEWLNNPTYVDNFARATRQFNNMLERHFARARDAEFGRIFNEVFDENGIAEGDAVSDPLLKKKILGDIVQRIALHVHSIPHAK